jgi:hypothetical protein
MVSSLSNGTHGLSRMWGQNEKGLLQPFFILLIPPGLNGALSRFYGVICTRSIPTVCQAREVGLHGHLLGFTSLFFGFREFLEFATQVLVTDHYPSVKFRRV